MDVDIAPSSGTNWQSASDENLMLNMNFFEDLATVKDELFSSFDTNSPIDTLDSLLSDFDQCMGSDDLGLGSSPERSSGETIASGSSGSCYASSSCSSTDLLHSDNEEYLSGGESGEFELDGSSGVDSSPLSVASSSPLQSAVNNSAVTPSVNVPESSRKPLVVPVSVRGAGTVCTVRILPASSSPPSTLSPSASCVDASRKPPVLHVKNVQKLRGSGPAARVIRVVRKQQQPSHAGLPVISVTSGSASGLSGLHWPRVPQTNGTSRVSLSAEERRLLEQEGLEIPTSWPLTRQQEYDLKRIRRKIRNKMSAQDSRKRKKQYYDSLEERVRVCTDENRNLHKRLRALEAKSDALATENETLTAQLRKATTRPPNPNQPAACLLLLLLLSVSLCILPGQRTKQSTSGHSLYTETVSPIVSTGPNIHSVSSPANLLRQLMTGVLASPHLASFNKPPALSHGLTAPLKLGDMELAGGSVGLFDRGGGGLDGNKLLMQMD